MHREPNPLLCDIETGMCEIPGTASDRLFGLAHDTVKPVQIVYYTDPICSTCWGIEPQLRKLKLEYGDVMDIEYRMGGLLPDWSYNSGGISKPADVAHHWDEVSAKYEMPIDGDVWLEDPLHSSYPPSIAFKAAQMQDAKKAITFLRLIREQLFLHKKNITRWEVIESAASAAGLDSPRLKADFDNTAPILFDQDLTRAQELGVKGFPTLFFTGPSGDTEKINGLKPYTIYETALKKAYPQARPAFYSREWSTLFSIYPTLTTREFAELSGMENQVAAAMLTQLAEARQIDEIVSKNGSIWRKCVN